MSKNVEVQGLEINYKRIIGEGYISLVLIEDGLPKAERLQKLNKIAILQMNVLNETSGRKLLK